MLIKSLPYSLGPFIVLLIVITVSLLVIHFLYNASMRLDKKEFKFRKNHKNILKRDVKIDNIPEKEEKNS